MIKYLVMDVDGSLTDGKIYMGADGEVMKAFSIKDGYAIDHILKANGIIPVVITARVSSMVQNRCQELGIQHVHQGKRDKLAALREIVGATEIGNCAYFGDDVIDLQCMRPVKDAGGVVGCPADAVQEIRATADYVCLAKAGEGALREFAEWLVKPQIAPREMKNRVDYAVSYLKNVSTSGSTVGQKIIVNENFYYTVQKYMTKPESRSKLESHREYVDIQVMVDGEESMDLADVSRLTVQEKYDPENDVMFWNIPDRMSRITLSAGDCVILYPENAHRGAIIKEKEGHEVLKIVGKVKIV